MASRSAASPAKEISKTYIGEGHLTTHHHVESQRIASCTFEEAMVMAEAWVTGSVRRQTPIPGADSKERMCALWRMYS
jgi:hypothetical protein